jgi:FkbM family methyltransferase
MYSQNNEEQFILEHFKNYPVGRLLDIGAYDGKTFSNSLALLEKGWTGVLVEPSPSVFLKLLENTKHVKVDLVNSAVSKDAEMLKFFDSNGDAISSFIPEHVEKWEKGYQCKFTPYYIKTIMLADIIHQFGVVYDFINLDVEGLNDVLFKEIMSYVVLLQHTKMICVEHDGHHQMMENLAACYGFRKIAMNGENLILGR